MAEAHQACVFAFNITDQGVQLEFDHAALRAVWRSGVRAYKKRYARFRNRLHNGIYPARPGSLLTAIFVVMLATMFGKDLSFGCASLLKPFVVRWLGVEPPHDTYMSCLLFTAALWLSAVLLYKWAASWLLSYHGWLYEARGPISKRTQCWMLLTRLLIRPARAGLFSFQSALPRLPVPPVADTVRRYLLSVEPLLDENEMAEMRQLAAEFEASIAGKLQRYLRLKSWWSPNYVSDWWEQFVYLYSRDPIMVNSNYYGMEAAFVHPSHSQVARAANASWTLLQFWRRLCREETPPIFVGGAVPLCSRQYDRLFVTTRLPGQERDRLVHFNDTRHVVVYHGGRYYKMYFHHDDRWLQPCELQEQLQYIVDDKSAPSDGEEELAALTAGPRRPWATARETFFRRNPNRASLEAIERAAFVLVLDAEPAEYDVDNPDRMDRVAKSLLHGNGCNRWFDKCFNLIVYLNGRLGFNAEHSWGDAVLLSHLIEEIIAEDHKGYTPEGNCKGIPKGPVPNPTRLQWQLKPECREIVSQQLRAARDLLQDVELHVVVHRQFGKGAIKQCYVSPDAFIQLALQLAYYRDSGGSFCLTYEASMTRLFREGRTETVRSCTNESCAFVKAFEEKAPRQKLVELMRQATNNHQRLYRDAMTGKGVDRHLFTLYVVSRYCKLQSPFLEKALHCQWKLSTSQTPHGQTEKALQQLREHPLCISAGGGFGPVSEQGYGVSYIIAGEDTIFFHVSCRVSSKETDARRFGSHICKAMSDLKSLFET